jgi:hypothetical protein
MLVEAMRSHGSAYHRLTAGRLVRSYWPQVADDCELLYTYGYRVAGDKFQECKYVEIGYPYSLREEPGEVLLDQLAELPDGTVAEADLAAALGRPPVPAPALTAVPDLPPLLAAGYTAFASCPKPGRLAGCPHCRPSGSDCALLRGEVGELTADTLDPYLTTAVSTCGTADDFRYFAPRILALAVTEQLTDSSLEIVLGKFRLAGWRQWPAGQRAAAEALLGYYWARSLAAHPGPRPIDEVLCALGNALDDLRPLLDRWVDRAAAPAAACHLRDFVAGAVTEARTRRRLRNAFWSGRPQQQAQVLDWLLSADLRRAVEAAFYRAQGTPAADPLAEAHEFLGP